MQQLLETIGSLAAVLLFPALVAILVAWIWWWRLRVGVGRRALQAQPPVIHLDPAAGNPGKRDRRGGAADAK